MTGKLRAFLAAPALAAVFLGWATPSFSADFSVPFAPKAGEKITYNVVHAKETSTGGTSKLTTEIHYLLDVTFDGTGNATTLIHDVSLFVGGEAASEVNDYDAMIYFAAERLAANVAFSARGEPEQVTNYAELKPAFIAKAKEKAASDLLKLAASIVEESSDPASAVFGFDRPLALSAVGRTVAFAEPDRSDITIAGKAFASFLPDAVSSWTFATKAVAGGYQQVDWAGIPEGDSMQNLLRPILRRLQAAADPKLDLEPILASARVKQTFVAQYADDTGIVAHFKGEQVVHLGPLDRHDTMEMSLVE